MSTSVVAVSAALVCLDQKSVVVECQSRCVGRGHELCSWNVEADDGWAAFVTSVIQHSCWAFVGESFNDDPLVLATCN
jgi:hypothetical protein